ncbi:uncharacterized protein TrAtP1_006743 [Trichoderma atroviride]|uniref:uncharacterized protein n=1 Tax=Hypocrea atroviridis TaxID=63577 RepID=UPI003331FFD9|nr:hypothetical protein TrAtP1_006743 [Trichoderma atroviride]
MAMAQNQRPLPMEMTKRIVELACLPNGPHPLRYNAPPVQVRHAGQRLQGMAGLGGAPHIPQPAPGPGPPRRRRPHRVPAASGLRPHGGPRRGAGAVWPRRVRRL